MTHSFIYNIGFLIISYELSFLSVLVSILSSYMCPDVAFFFLLKSLISFEDFKNYIKALWLPLVIVFVCVIVCFSWFW